MELMIVIAIIGILVKLGLSVQDYLDLTKINGEAKENLAKLCELSRVDQMPKDGGGATTSSSSGFRTCPICMRDDTGWWSPEAEPDRTADLITSVPYAFSEVFNVGESIYCSYRMVPLDSVNGTVYFAKCDLDANPANGVTIVACVSEAEPCSDWTEGTCNDPRLAQSDFVNSLKPTTYANVGNADSAITSLTIDVEKNVSLSFTAP